MRWNRWLADSQFSLARAGGEWGSETRKIMQMQRRGDAPDRGGFPFWFPVVRRVANGILITGLTAFVLPLLAILPLQQALAAAGVGAAPTGTVTIVSPSSGQGPVGATVTVNGSGWVGASQVSIGVATSTTACANTGTWSATVGQAAPASDGSFTKSFIWPAALGKNANPYYVCAGEASLVYVASTNTYTVLSNQPPVLTLSTLDIQAGKPVTITGSNFYGAPSGNSIRVSINGNLVQSVAADGQGTFAVTYTTAPRDVGNATVTASSPSEGGAPPALTASASLVVQAAPTVTATVSASPSASVAVTPTVAQTVTVGGSAASNGGSSPGNSSSNGLLLGLVIASIIALAVIAGLIAFVIMRRRNGSAPAYLDPYSGYAGSGYNSGPQHYGPGTDRYNALPPFARSGPYDVTDPIAHGSLGGVSQWDEPDPTPGPDWQPRPMSGRRDPVTGGYFDDQETYLPPTGVRSPAGPGAFGPADPWATDDGYGLPPGDQPQSGATRPASDPWDPGH